MESTEAAAPKPVRRKPPKAPPIPKEPAAEPALAGGLLSPMLQAPHQEVSA